MISERNTKIMIRLGKFFTPFLLGFGVYWIWSLFSDNLFKIWPFLVAYFFPPFGKETVIPIATKFAGDSLTVPLLNLHLEPLGIDPLAIALAVAFIDIVVALFLVWNYDLAKKIPLIGKFMIKAENLGKGSSDRYSWFKSLRFIGIVLFVMVPFQGSGGLVGSIVGRLFGMKPWTTFFAISVGAITGCLLIAYFTQAILYVFKDYLLVVFIVVIITIVALMFYFNKKNKNSQKEKK